MSGACATGNDNMGGGSGEPCACGVVQDYMLMPNEDGSVAVRRREIRPNMVSPLSLAVCSRAALRPAAMLTYTSGALSVDWAPDMIAPELIVCRGHDHVHLSRTVLLCRQFFIQGAGQPGQPYDRWHEALSAVLGNREWVPLIDRGPCAVTVALPVVDPIHQPLAGDLVRCWAMAWHLAGKLPAAPGTSTQSNQEGK